MKTRMVKTTIKDIAIGYDLLKIGERLVFSAEDPDDCERYGFEPVERNAIWKANVLHEDDYVVIIGRIMGHQTIAKDIHILTNGNIHDKEARIVGVENFIQEYYDKYVEKHTDSIYLLID